MPGERAAAAANADLIIRNATIATDRAPEYVRSDIAIRAGRLSAIEETLPAADETATLDAAGLFAVPGLIDCEVHLVLAASPAGIIDPRESLATTALVSAINAKETLRAGVTAIRDLGGREYVEFSLRELVDAGALPGPRMKLCGKIVSITGSGAAAFPGMYREADGSDEVRKAAREQLRAGADAIKVMATGAALAGEDPGAPQFTVAELSAAAEEAHIVGKPLIAHAHSAPGIRNALAAGADVIGHGTFLHEAPDAIEQMAERGVFLVPTLKLWHSILELGVQGGVPAAVVQRAQRAADHHERSFAAAVESGVRIAMGTDAGTPYNRHGDNARELELMVNAGLTPHQALAAATQTAAECLDIPEAGAIQVDKRADLVLVEGNPLVRIRDLVDRVRAVVKDGVVIRNDLVSTGTRAHADVEP